jgi:neutral ceramidase
VPHILPIQYLRIGKLLLACVPGEITTVAGLRLEQALLTHLEAQGIEEVIISSYSNAYMGYITTPEEYEAQCYEGGHTVHGRHSLRAFTQAFLDLTLKLSGHPPKLSCSGPFAFPPEELSLRTLTDSPQD